MHIPDGFLSNRTWIALAGVSAAAVAVAGKRAAKGGDEKRIPLTGVMAAFIFAAQMLNFPIAAGTSGHFTGAALAAVLLGPFTGVLVMAAVLIVQCLVFQDGGITALGANIFNMAVVGSLGGFVVYAVLKKIVSERPAAAAAAWLSVVLASAACALELAVSKIVPLKSTLFMMTGFHALTGIAEAVITWLVLTTLQRARPDLLSLEKI